MISKSVYLILGILGLIYLTGCNNAFVTNLSTNYDTDVDSLKISFKLNGSNSKRYNVKMSIINNLTGKEELLNSKSILPSPNYLKPKNYNFSVKAEQFDLSKNIYSIKLSPTIARKISDIKLEQTPKEYKFKILANLGFVGYELLREPDGETIPFYIMPSLTLGYFNKTYGFTVGSAVRGRSYIGYFMKALSDGYTGIILDNRRFYSIGAHKKVSSNLFFGINLGVSTLDYIFYNHSNPWQYGTYGPNYWAIDDININQEIYNESGISVTYIKNKINFQLNVSGLSLGYTDYYNDLVIGQKLKFFVHPSVSLGVGYNFGF